MGDFTKIIREGFGKIGEFLNILDLSFFVSGAVCLGAVFYYLYINDSLKPFSYMNGWLQGGVILLSCYILGLICFAIGRKIRNWIKFLSEDRNTIMKKAVEEHNLMEKKPFKEYPEKEDKKNYDYLYIRLWVELRQIEEFVPSHNLLWRYWVLTATYDSLGAALIFWALIFISDAINRGILENIIIVLVLIVMAIACFSEAWRLVRHQAEEIIATLAYYNGKFETDDL